MRNGNREDLRDDLELALLENVMKAILLKVLKLLGIPCSVDRENIDLRIYDLRMDIRSEDIRADAERP